MRSANAVSVVIPNHNRGDLLGSAIASALAQRGVELEVLVCDDGSTDGSAGVVEAFDDPRVRWLPGPASGGPATPRNRGIAAAAGEWVAFLDSDDTWREGKLEAQLRLLESMSASACTTNAYRCLPGSAGPAGLMHDRLPATITLSLQLSLNWVITSSMTVRTAELHHVGGFPEAAGRTIFEDYALWLRLAQRSPIAVLDAPLVDYRDEVSSSLRGLMAPELRCTINSFRDFGRWRRSQRPPLRTTSAEALVMARHLSRLVAVRDILRRGLAPAPGSGAR